MRIKLLILGLLSFAAFAESSLNYSGRLVNVDGSPVTGPVNLTFDLAYASAPGTIICSKTVNAISLTQGVFHTRLNFLAADCTGSKPLTQVLAETPVGDTVAIRVTDVTHAKVYGFQSLNAMPFSVMADIAKTLDQMGATPGQILMWDGSKWAPDDVGAGAGSVTQVNTGTGLTGGPITTTGTISIAAGGVDTTQLADGSVTNDKLAGSIARSKLAVGLPNYVLMNDVGGNVSEVAQLPVASGGTGASTPLAARTNLGIGTSAVFNYAECLPGEVSRFVLPGGWACIADNTNDTTKLPLLGGTMDGNIDMDTHQIKNVAAPTELGDAVNKAYVDGEISGIAGSQWSSAAPDIYFNTGDVGVGTATPTTKLHVAGGKIAVSETNSAYGMLQLGNPTTPGAGNLSQTSISFMPGVTTFGNPTASSERWELGANLYTSEVGIFGLHNGTGYVWQANRTTGNLGIGTTPHATYKVNVNGQLNATEICIAGDCESAWPSTGAPSGAASGDLTGTYPGPTIATGSVTYAKTNFADGDIPQAKVNGLATSLSGKEPTLTAGTALQYYRGDKTWQTLNTTAVPEGTNLYFTEPRVLGTDLAGLSVAAGDVTATDTVITAIGKLQGTFDSFITGGIPLENNLSMGGFRITNLNAPSAGGDATTKTYVDNAISTAISGVGSSQWTTNTTMIHYNTGNVGIGVSSPAFKLHVKHDVNSPAGLLVENASSGASAEADIILGSDRTRVGVIAFADQDNTAAASGNIAYNHATDALTFRTNLVDKAIITSSGNMGLGTDTPNDFGATSKTFEIKGTDFGYLRIGGGTHTLDLMAWSGGVSELRAASDFAFKTVGTEKMRLNAGGSLGIGTSAPQSLLHLNNNNLYQLRFSNPSTAATSGDGVAIGLSGSELQFNSLESAGYQFRSGANSLMTLSGAGNVLIGTGTATTRLHVIGSVTLGDGGESCTAGNFAGAIRYSGGVVEYCNGASWQAFAIAGGSTPSDNSVTSAKIANGAITNDDVNAAANIDASKLGTGTVSNTEFNYLDGVTSAIQTQLNAKEGTLAAGTAAQYYRGDKTWQTLNTSVVPELTNLYFTEARVRATPITGYGVGTAIPLAATDSVMDAFGKLEAQNIALDTAFDNAGQWSKASSDIYFNTGNVGIGTAAPGLKLHVTGDVAYSGAIGSNIPASTAILMEVCPAGWTDLGATGGGPSAATCNATTCRRCQSPSTTLLPSQSVLLLENCPSSWSYINTPGGPGSAGQTLGYSGCRSPVGDSIIPAGTKLIAQACPVQWADRGPVDGGPLAATCGGVSCRICEIQGVSQPSVVQSSGSTLSLQPNSGKVNIGNGNGLAYLSVGAGSVAPVSDVDLINFSLTSNVTDGAVGAVFNNGTKIYSIGVTDDMALESSSSGAQPVGIGTAMSFAMTPFTDSAAGADTFTNYVFRGGTTAEDMWIQNGRLVTRGINLGFDRLTTLIPNNSLLVNGNVGIGTATPSQKLHVLGNIQSNNDYYTSKTFSDGWAVGDYQEFVQASGVGAAGSSGLYHITIAATRGNWTENTTYTTLISHSDPDIWREIPMVSANYYTGFSYRCFAVDANTGSYVIKFRLRAIRPSSDCSPSSSGNLPIYVKVTSQGQNAGWTALTGSGTGATVTGYRTNVGSEWNLYTGASANAGIHTITARNGNVGIGTTNPTYKLDVTGSVNVSGSVRMASGKGSIGYYNTVPYDQVEMGTNDPTTDLSFFTNSISRVWIKPNGLVGIGIKDPTYTLHVNGSVAGTSAYNNLSDGKLKKNIKPLESSLSKIQKLEGVSYEWRQNEFPEKNLGKRRELGVIAQNVEKVYPEAVSVDKTGTRSVAYSMLIAPLIESVKELYKFVTESDERSAREIASLKSENEALKKQNAEIEARLQRLEQKMIKDGK